MLLSVVTEVLRYNVVVPRVPGRSGFCCKLLSLFSVCTMERQDTRSPVSPSRSSSSDSHADNGDSDCEQKTESTSSILPSNTTACKDHTSSSPRGSEDRGGTTEGPVFSGEAGGRSEVEEDGNPLPPSSSPSGDGGQDTSSSQIGDETASTDRATHTTGKERDCSNSGTRVPGDPPLDGSMQGGGGEEANASQSAGRPVLLTVKVVNGDSLSVSVDPSITVDEWRQQLESLVRIPPHQQRLVASGRVLQVRTPSPQSSGNEGLSSFFAWGELYSLNCICSSQRTIGTSLGTFQESCNHLLTEGDEGRRILRFLRVSCVVEDASFRVHTVRSSARQLRSEVDPAGTSTAVHLSMLDLSTYLSLCLEPFYLSIWSLSIHLESVYLSGGVYLYSSLSIYLSIYRLELFVYLSVCCERRVTDRFSVRDISDKSVGLPLTFSFQECVLGSRPRSVFLFLAGKSVCVILQSLS